MMTGMKRAMLKAIRDVGELTLQLTKLTVFVGSVWGGMYLAFIIE